ncbi:nickel pincer cofactor biosynthesis protein LarC [Sporosarcina sp. G11-34]|uniref:nickel pincer cofactor biosynthesis protein LarC n=1 Tax=Sporosarcina sp. G11-34 TaxID=2849605 RepID=UPI0022A9AF48|nr:nickel pincer cofactor biosynthesis protein LarC [Sporosarcina sp. G11-34]MCZ2258466.1 nickel pincer cofactor biosynthesis protein LarC [Sporosarcina sp. G11-34]
MKILYFDCFSGISGDMVIGALIDAGGDSDNLVQELKKLNIKNEYELKFDKVIKNGITSTKFDVLLTHEKHEEGHEDNHKHDHDLEEHEHHDHRSYKDIVKLIKAAEFSEEVQSTAINIFKRIGVAEGKIHGVPLDEVHFHEVGAVDSIIDIVGTAILLNQLNIKMIKSSPIPVGSGKIHIDHGVYPVPAPATLEILRGIPIAKSDLSGELATPTGAAIAGELATEFCTIPAMTVESIGYGAGTKSFPNHPNVLRVIIGE